MKHEQREYRGIVIHLMRIKNKLGWTANIDGEDYGAWSQTDSLKEQDIKEHFDVHFTNAKDSIDIILNDKK